MLKKVLAAAAVLAIAAPAGAAMAQEGHWGSWGHERDHEEHGAFHDEADEGHEIAHEQGFRSRAEHEGYHRALRGMHREFHDEHAGTRHDGYRLPREGRGRNYYGGYRRDGRGGYDYQPYSYGPGVTFSFGGW